jgi:hypothetical protein
MIWLDVVSIQEAEAGGSSRVQDQSELYNKTLYQQSKKVANFKIP